MINRTFTFAKHHTPSPVRVAVRWTMLETRNARSRLTVPVTTRCEYDNVYHCTVRKTASQWVKSLLSDPVVYRHSGLLPFDQRVHRRRYPDAIPPGRVASSLFVSRKRFDSIPKPEKYRAFFIQRDPRDIVVSSYFSLRGSHTPMGDILQHRKILRETPAKEGMLYIIKHLSETNLFSCLRSWVVAPSTEAVRIFRYEDLTGEQQLDEVDQLLRHCGIALPRPDLVALLERHGFSRMRKTRLEDGSNSHYRKGEAGDWMNHFDDDIYEAFVKATGDLVQRCGYPTREEALRDLEAPHQGDPVG
ncbi:sulfotransferase domain-containing protein [Micromonospora sp. NBC_01813]|uniref:sulfotransferase domain-containing protein n=1 Tax=Micromonospora sp. NBC_01813 TaxID=2975988 RepID=UPI002DD9B090|nr:sulfotransferase domain-containing protein [Micromonospora sp. NBC_01813]WSA12481.1 sulfotransferase domain-containing protein [Micromonospora sp. NBC_01813]